MNKSMKKKVSRLLSVCLVVILLFSISLPASALSVNRQTRATTIGIVTCGDKIFGRWTKLTIKNTGTSPMKVSLVKNSGCSVKRGAGVGYSSWSSATVYGGNSCNIWIKTTLGNSGVVHLRFVSCFGTGDAYSYSITNNDGSAMARIG